MSAANGLDFLVNRSDWAQTRSVEGPVPDLEDGQVLLRVDRFALTANNISYALSGDMLGYWRFFPAEDGWGRIPTMGFGDVIRSAHADVAEGQRFFGFYPMSRHLVIQAAPNAAGLVDVAAHREGLAPAYSQLSRTTTDALYEADFEDELILLRGLFMTSFLVDDFLADSDFFGAQQTVVTSASSKTSIALGFQLKRRGHHSVGLTSPRNREFVEGLGLYDDVVLYDDVKSIRADVPAVIVDMAGNGQVLSTFHHHLGEGVRHSCIVGATHWDAGQRDGELPGAEPTFFFAPAQIQKRSQEWGPEGFQQRLGDGWKSFRESTAAWLRVARHQGVAALESVYQDTLAGRTAPSTGNVISLWESDRS